MGVFTLILVLLWITKWLLQSLGSRVGLSAGQQTSLDFVTLLFIIPLIFYFWQFVAGLRGRFLFKIRHRLVLANVFIGAIPVLVAVVIIYVSGLLFYYQFSYYLILNQIGIHIAQAHAFNLTLRASLDQAIAGSQMDREGLQSVLDRESKYILGTYPSATVILQIQNRKSGPTATFTSQRKIPDELLKNYRVPRWTADADYSGLILEDSDLALYRYSKATQTGGAHGQLFLRSLIIGNYSPESTYTLEVSVPFDRHLMVRLKSAVGQEMLLADGIAGSNLNVMLQNTKILRQNILSATFDLANDNQALGKPVWSILLFPTAWSTGYEVSRADNEVLFVELSSSKLIQNLFRSESNVGQTIFGALKLIVGFFLAVEVISVIIGIVITKSITNAVFSLDRGTEFIKRGDFSHRIVVRSNDQLGALAKSFNQMTEYIQTLIKERVQRERLERELEIAKEVQEQLFPREAPRMKSLELTGVCLPARVVSGDYYDFLQFDSGSMGIALGDICGKGISAALLMANLQATLRSNVINTQRGGPVSHVDDGAVASVVQKVNQQIYSYTSANKFASFFYAVYEDATLRLTYCNAGHNPPLYFTNGTFRRLSVGGTVVGIFADAEYQQETLHLAPNDLLVGYTDGIIESVNEYGEEFGEERLIHLIDRNKDLHAEDIQKIIFDEVLRWSYEDERDDDMTLIVSKIV